MWAYLWAVEGWASGQEGSESGLHSLLHLMERNFGPLDLRRIAEGQ